MNMNTNQCPPLPKISLPYHNSTRHSFITGQTTDMHTGFEVVCTDRRFLGKFDQWLMLIDELLCDD